MIYLIIGVDRQSLAPWHENVGAADVAAAKGIACAHAQARGIRPVVAAAVGPNCVVVEDPALVAEITRSVAA
jgi:hypothetical protein